MQTRSQQYAEPIYRQVSSVPEGDRKKYGGMAHKLPVLIRTAGLAQAIAFVNSRCSPEQIKLLDHIAEVVGVSDLAERSRKATLPEYMHLTRRVMTALEWYKRFSQSVLGVEADEAHDVGEAT